jgi:hypothetical protein
MRSFRALDGNAQVFREDKTGRLLRAHEVAHQVGWNDFADELARQGGGPSAYVTPWEMDAKQEQTALQSLTEIRLGGKEKENYTEMSSQPNEIRLLFGQGSLDFVIEIATGVISPDKKYVYICAQPGDNKLVWVQCAPSFDGPIKAEIRFPALTGNNSAKKRRVLLIRARPLVKDEKGETSPPPFDTLRDTLQEEQKAAEKTGQKIDKPTFQESYVTMPIQYLESASWPERTAGQYAGFVPARAIPMENISDIDRVGSLFGGNKQKKPKTIYIGLRFQTPVLPKPLADYNALKKEQKDDLLLTSHSLVSGEFLMRMPLLSVDSYVAPDWRMIGPSKKFPLRFEQVESLPHRFVCYIETNAIYMSEWVSNENKASCRLADVDNDARNVDNYNKLQVYIKAKGLPETVLRPAQSEDVKKAIANPGLPTSSNQ